MRSTPRWTVSSQLRPDEDTLGEGEVLHESVLDAGDGPLCRYCSLSDIFCDYLCKMKVVMATFFTFDGTVQMVA